MKNKITSDFSRQKLPTSTADKLVKHIHENFSTSINGVNLKSLPVLQKLTKRLAAELGYKPTILEEKMDREHMLIYALILLTNGQSALMSENPQLSRTNQLAIINIAESFGVPNAEDSDSLLQSIALKFRIINCDKIGDELTERLLCVPKIISEFKLDRRDPDLLFNTDNLCAAIRQQCEDTSFLDRMVTFLELPPGSSEVVVMKLLSKRLSIQDQTEQIQILKKQNYELHEKLNEWKTKSSSSYDSPKKSKTNVELEYAEQRNAELTTKSKILEDEVKALKIKISDLERLARSSPQKVQGNLKEANKLLEAQIDSQRSEIENGFGHRKDLLDVIQKQSQLMSIYDRLMSESKETQLSPKRLRQVQSPIVDNKIFEIIADAIENAPPDIVDGVLKVIKSEKFTKTEKMKKIITFFIEEVRKQRQNVGSVKANKGECERLVTAMHSQLRFLENLVSCDDDIQLIFEEPDEAKKAIQEQVLRIEQFLKQNAKGFVEDANIFDTLQLNVNPLELSKRIQSFLDRYPTIRTPEGDELLIMLRMSLAANGILRRFAITTRNQTEKQMNDIRTLNNELAKVTAERERRTGYMLQQINEEAARRQKAEQSLSKLKLMINKGSINPAVLDNLTEKSNSEIGDVSRQSVEKQLQQALSELSKTKAQLESSKYSPTKDEALQADLQQQVEKQLYEIGQYVDQINTLKNEIDQLNQKLASMQVKNDRLSQEIACSKEKFQSRIKQLKTEGKSKNNEENSNNVKSEKQKCELLKQQIQKMKTNRQELKSKMADKDAKLLHLEALRAQLTEDINSQKEAYLKLDGLLRQTQTQKTSCEFENKMLLQKIKSLEEKEDHNYASNASKSNLNEAHQSFLMQIFNEMKSYFIDTSKIDDDSVLSMLRNVKSQNKELQSKRSELQEVVKEIRLILALEKRDDLITAVAKLKKGGNDLISPYSPQKSSPSSNGQNSKDWEDWARTLYNSLTINKRSPPPISTVKSTIEIALKSNPLTKLESLRTQKRFLLLFAVPKPDKTKPLQFRSLMTVIVGAVLIQKVSGCVPRSIEEAHNPPKSRRQKRYSDDFD